MSAKERDQSSAALEGQQMLDEIIHREARVVLYLPLIPEQWGYCS
jgi:hypothetical protein